MPEQGETSESYTESSADPRGRPAGRLKRFLKSTWADRLFSLLVMAPAGTVLWIAWTLHPDPAGMGTHRQLGLGPCTFYAFTGWPCPTCGMTTTFSMAAHGRLLDALVNQPFGVALFFVNLAAVVVAVLEITGPRQRWRRIYAWVMDREGWVALAMLLGMVGGWGVRLLHYFRP